jgi:UDP-N-acetylmuramate-alanine ligase
MMSDYNWCHNDKCHTYHTTDRIRGVKGNKVLRTRKIRVTEPHRWWQGWENHFCSVSCFFQFAKKHITNIVALAPVYEPSETPIDVKVESRDSWRHIYNHEHNTYERVPHVEKTKTIIAK